MTHLPTAFIELFRVGQRLKDGGRKMRSVPLTLLLSTCLASCPVFAQEWSGRVVGVSDGDTLTVLNKQTPRTVRLAGIDCPEKSQAFGQKAKAFTSECCFGKTVTVVEHGKDRYGRTLGEVISDSGVNLNHKLVRSGLAWHYTRFSKDPILSDLEAKARTEQLELWQDENAIEPWLFRKQRKKQSAK